MSKIKSVDTTMRDGSHAIKHQYTPEMVGRIAGALDACKVDVIEVSHGDGIGGSSINYGFGKCDEMELLKAARVNIQHAELAVLLLPGIGTIEDLKQARETGVSMVRVATHVTEADIAIQHLKAAKLLGMKTVGFLMMTHMASPETILEQSKIFVDCGVDYINLADSAGYLTPDMVRERISILKSKLDVPVGFHAHNNLGLAVANAMAAAGEGAQYLDVTLRGIGAGAGNAQSEVLCSVLQREGYDLAVDSYGLMDAAQDLVEPIMLRPQVIDTASLMLGYAGVYSSFYIHTCRAAERFGLNPRDILVEIGKRKMVGGQEDMIIDVAYALAEKKKAEGK